jgi:CopG family nickel-responsive transcriptional regulator
LDDELAQAFDEMMQREGYQNRSEAYRDLLRRELQNKRLLSGATKKSVAIVSYLFDHEKSHFVNRLSNCQHKGDSNVITTLHIHASENDCVESVVLKGPTEAVIKEAKGIAAATHIQYCGINLIPLEDA